MGGGAGYLFAALLLSLVLGLVLFALGIGFFDLYLRSETGLPFISIHVIYGLILGFIVGLWLPVIDPMF
jgi:uncharacterized protein YybS (DUF2232 family)